MSSNDDSAAGNGAPDLTPHPLVSKLHPEPDEHAAYATFTGYLGPSSKSDYHRIYLDQSFGTYVEVPQDAIVATTPASPGDDNGPTHVSVKSDAPVRYVSVTSHAGSASYLSGGIASAHLPAGAPASPAGGPLCITIATHSPTWCHPPICPTVFTANPTNCHGPCATIVTAVPTCDATGIPGQNHTCMLTIFTANVTTCAPRLCATFMTSNPTYCQHPPICATLLTARPTSCEHPCVLTIVTSNPSACP